METKENVIYNSVVQKGTRGNMRSKHVLLFTLSIPSSVVLTVASLLYSEYTNATDFVATKYGFPYWWLMNIHATVAGLTDVWSYEISNLAKDMALFFLLSLVFWLVILLKKRGTVT